MLMKSGRLHVGQIASQQLDRGSFGPHAPGTIWRGNRCSTVGSCFLAGKQQPRFDEQAHTLFESDLISERSPDWQERCVAIDLTILLEGAKADGQQGPAFNLHLQGTAA
jgi:hypothetical protein